MHLPLGIFWWTRWHNASTSSRKIIVLRYGRQPPASLTDLVNILLAGDLPTEVTEIIFGGRLMALEKKGGGIRPIAIGYTYKRLAAKCANRQIISRRGAALQPIQLEVGVPGGAEAAIHATRRYVQQLNDNHVLVKLDFNNAFNSIRRDLVLDSTAEKKPRALPLCLRLIIVQSNTDVWRQADSVTRMVSAGRSAQFLLILRCCTSNANQPRLHSSTRFYGRFLPIRRSQDGG